MRNDIHRPSAINPTDYHFVAFEYIKVESMGDAIYLGEQRRLIACHMERTGGKRATHEHGGTCNVCGAAAMYTALFHHVPSNEYIRVGQDCADKLDCGDWDAFRKVVRDAREQAKGKTKAKAVLTDAGIAKAYDIWDVNGSPAGREEEIICEIVMKLVKYGSISDKQIAFVRKLLNNIETRADRMAARAAEHAAAAPLPVSDKRVTIRGTVITIRVPDYDRGDCGPIRMLVQHADGWKVWGSVPSNLLADLKRGQQVEFNATIKSSDKDEKFGFFSRPTKARILEQVAAA
ncbi:hypothetical protein ACQR1I_36725 [Bradyrhizobium sp. HKCCYLS2038]|uniref:hypothetical protein n=1 Tax=Bradyrhizobium sp. HKCCYLS2038 TaxID=3420764 RepID=UPI003EBD4C63